MFTFCVVLQYLYMPPHIHLIYKLPSCLPIVYIFISDLIVYRADQDTLCVFLNILPADIHLP